MPKWEKVANREWRADGEKGTWFITQCGTVFWGRYVSNNGFKAFKMRPTRKLSEAKAARENNYYWEGEKPQATTQADKPKPKPQTPCGPVQQTIPI